MRRRHVRKNINLDGHTREARIDRTLANVAELEYPELVTEEHVLNFAMDCCETPTRRDLNEIAGAQNRGEQGG